MPATSQSAEATVLLPFSSKLRVDKGLKLSHDDFKNSVEEFYANKQFSAIDQIKATPPYPTPQVLAQFANIAYLDCKHTDPKPPDDWQLLTTASHFGIKNGYFGTAYWHPEHQQVVIAHRGTDIKNVGALVTDVKGVFFNNCVEQMRSASTFANMVVAVLQEIEQVKKVSFELFFTGHSLGGWLAQVTNFTTEYLEVNGGIFLMKQKRDKDKTLTSSTVQDSHDIQKDGPTQINSLAFQYIKYNPDAFLKNGKTKQGEKSYHSHTVVFDSPGCKEMLLNMKDRYDLRNSGRSIDLEHLDITSYLSAPNLVNTCNSHVGTVYRIFIDLSDMGWKETLPILYDRATHSMDKIVEAFDPETGQVLKDDKDVPKIREVEDWPRRASLIYGEELKEFFKFAEGSNNYNPDISHIKVPNGYLRLRYQTKAYDDCKKSLSVFTEEEREFLECYCWLRHVQKFLKREDLFCAMENDEVESRAEQILQKYELDNESVHCADASTLQMLIPYVKRLVRHFPQVKKNIKDKLSQPHIINNIYQHETGRNVAKIKEIPLDFKLEALGLREFLTSDQQIWQLRMVDGDVWTVITKVYRVLQNTSCAPSYSSEGNYTILKLKRLLTVNGMINLNALLASEERPHLLMIACGTNQADNGELQKIFQELFNILKQKKNVKIILTTQTESDIADFIEEIATETLGDGFITTDEQLTWSDLTAGSQRKVLEQTVIFQGRRIALNQLISAESMADSFPLADLVQGKELRIGEEAVPSSDSDYNETYYIDRTFNHNIVIRQDILSDEGKGEFHDFFASTKQEFEELCEKYPTNNVHWLENDNSGVLFWQQSLGNLKTLRKYIDNQKSHCYAPSDLENLLQQAKKQRVMIIADKAGMGKTTVLTHLSKCIKQNFPAHWLVRINLNDYTKLLNAQKGKKVDKGWVLEFLSKKMLQLESDIEKELFKKSFEGNEINKVVVMVDGFDEISPKFKTTVIDMLHVLKQTSVEQLWVTTRPHLRGDLEDNLQQLSYTLQPFSVEEQVEFLKKFWLRNSNLEATKPHRLQIYAEALIRNLAQSISDKDKEFTGIPLQTHMIAEAFKEGFRIFYESEKPQPELPQKFNLLELYREFIKSKYNIYYEGKSKTLEDNVGAGDIRDRDVKNIKLRHQLLALEVLFPEDQLRFLQIYCKPANKREDLARIGIVQINQEGKLQFIHRTFAEYYVAEFLIKKLTKKTKQSVEVQDFLINNLSKEKEQHTQLVEFLLNTVLLATDCHIIRVFLNGQLKKSELSHVVLKEVGKELEIWKEREKQGTALHKAAKEDNVHIIEFLLESLKSGGDLSIVTEMLLHEDRWGQTAWHKAAENDIVQALTTIWGWAEAVTVWQEGAERGHLETSDTTHAPVEEVERRPNQLKKKLFVARDQYGNTAWHGAAQRGSLKALQTLWTWAKEAGLTPHELLLDKNEEGNTAWQVAVQRGNFEVLEKIWAWAKEAKINLNDLKNYFLLRQDNNGYTVWNRAAESGSLETLKTLRNLSKEAKLKTDEMFLAQGKDGNAAWQVAAQRGHFELLKKLWEWAKGEKMGGNVLKDKLLLATDQDGYTAWHRAAERGNVQALQALWNWAKEEELDPDELLSAQSKKGLTAWHLAADRDHFEAFKIMWEWAEEALKSPKDLKKKLVLTKDKTGYTVCHRTAQRGTLEELEILWRWAKKKLNKDELSLAQNEKENAA